MAFSYTHFMHLAIQNNHFNSVRLDWTEKRGGSNLQYGNALRQMDGIEL